MACKKLPGWGSHHQVLYISCCPGSSLLPGLLGARGILPKLTQHLDWNSDSCRCLIPGHPSGPGPWLCPNNRSRTACLDVDPPPYLDHPRPDFCDLFVPWFQLDHCSGQLLKWLPKFLPPGTQPVTPKEESTANVTLLRYRRPWLLFRSHTLSLLLALSASLPLSPSPLPLPPPSTHPLSPML